MKISRLVPLRLAPVLGAAVLVGGCMAGPDFHPPAAPAVDRYTAQPLPAVVGHGSDAQHFITGEKVSSQWWTLFGSPRLDALVAQALRANPSVAAAQAALRVAQETAAAQKGTLFPVASTDFSAIRERNANVLASPLESNADYFTLHTAQVSVSYALDVFGGNRRQFESLEAQAAAQRFQLDAAYLSLTSNVVVAAINEASLRAQIDTTQRIIDSQEAIFVSFRKQLALGQVSLADIAAQEATLAQTRALLPPLTKQLDQQRDALAALLGAAPADAPVTRFTLADLHLPHELPLSLPSQLVEQRPDVRAAEAELHAASAEVGVAVANRLPKFTLSAGSGYAATDIAALFSSGALFWNLAADVAQPVFSGGSLKHQQRAAEAAFDQAKAQYRATVIAALQNVADTLHALKNDADALAAAQSAARATAHSLIIARREFELGDVSGLAVLQAQQTDWQSRLALVQAKVNRYSDTAALFQSLGGGWWQRDAARRPGAVPATADTGDADHAVHAGH